MILGVTTPPSIPELFTALNKAGYVDDDIRCEDSSDAINNYYKIVNKCKLPDTKARKVHRMLIDLNYIQDQYDEALGFII